MRHLAALLLIGLSSSCFMSRSTTNEPLQRAKLEQLHPGTSTAKDVVELLGAPNEVIQLGTRSAYRYDFSTLKTAGFTVIIFTALNQDLRADRAWLFFDSKEVLTHLGTTYEAAKTQYAVPWEEIHGR